MEEYSTDEEEEEDEKEPEKKDLLAPIDTVCMCARQRERRCLVGGWIF